MQVKYIIGHWSGGGSLPNHIDLQSYQLLIDYNGMLYNGLQAGCTSSTAGMNSITYNIACCGGLSSSKLTPVQMEKFCYVCAQKINFYRLSVSDFYTHAEIGELCRNGGIEKLLPKNAYLRQNIGKIDLTILPYFAGSAMETGEFLRTKIKWYLNNL